MAAAPDTSLTAHAREHPNDVALVVAAGHAVGVSGRRGGGGGGSALEIMYHRNLRQDDGRGLAAVRRACLFPPEVIFVRVCGLCDLMFELRLHLRDTHLRRVRAQGVIDTVNVHVPLRLSLDHAPGASSRWRRVSIDSRNPPLVSLGGTTTTTGAGAGEMDRGWWCARAACGHVLAAGHVAAPWDLHLMTLMARAARWRGSS